MRRSRSRSTRSGPCGGAGGALAAALDLGSGRAGASGRGRPGGGPGGAGPGGVRHRGAGGTGGARPCPAGGLTGVPVRCSRDEGARPGRRLRGVFGVRRDSAPLGATNMFVTIEV
ncbi:hypothetical protein CP967_10785 [Streptomyces nitrosporeus]|uniref:Uncharacterized protein n=1 Tax=Streptomyces nitrosporeus TaxID=28894 RepID=A0A5J6F8V4_9ACTN|nr:hypothetical protein CP967_10785 [Streptomyces nitrosporeus]